MTPLRVHLTNLGCSPQVSFTWKNHTGQAEPTSGCVSIVSGSGYVWTGTGGVDQCAGYTWTGTAGAGPSLTRNSTDQAKPTNTYPCTGCIWVGPTNSTFRPAPSATPIRNHTLDASESSAAAGKICLRSSGRNFSLMVLALTLQLV